MNTKYIIAILAVLAVGVAGYFVYNQSSATDDIDATPDTGQIPSEVDTTAKPYVSSTSTDRYVINIDITPTGISAIDSTKRTRVQQNAAEVAAMATSVDSVVAPYEYSVTSDEYADSQTGIDSQVLSIYQYTGGAHGMVNFSTSVYDADTGKIYTLSDILRDEQASVQYLYEQVQAMVGEFNPDNVWVREGSGTDWNNYELFYVREGGITIIFPPYQIAPYAAGIFELELNWEELEPYLQTQFADTVE